MSLVVLVALAGGAAYTAGYFAARALRPQGLDCMPVKARDAAMVRATASEREQAIGMASRRALRLYIEQQMLFAEARARRGDRPREAYRGFYVVEGGRG